MLGFRFSEYTPDPNQTTFDKLFDIFKELITHTSGDVDEALDWLQQLDDQYNLTDEDYTMDDFIEDLKTQCSKRINLQVQHANQSLVPKQWLAG